MALPQPIARTGENRASNSEVAESILLRGDLSKLSASEQAKYVVRVCQMIGVDPLTQPIEILKLKGRTVLYAKKDCTDQLRKVHKISVVESAEQELGGVYIVVTKVKNADGRTDIARGAVSIKGLQGDDLANALMKAETKAKRRATLSICGLGILDESEIETIKEAKPKSSAQAKRDGTDDVFNEIRAHIRASSDLEMLSTIADSYAQELADMPTRWKFEIAQDFEYRWTDLQGEIKECPVRAGEELG